MTLQPITFGNKVGFWLIIKCKIISEFVCWYAYLAPVRQLKCRVFAGRYAYLAGTAIRHSRVEPFKPIFITLEIHEHA